MGKEPPVYPRRASRERLLQALYQLRVGGEWQGVEALRASFPDERLLPAKGGAGEEDEALAPAPESDAHPAEAGPPPRGEDRDFTVRLAEVLVERLEEVDRRIAEASRNWRPERMAAVDLSVLRLGTAELLAETAPVRVVINEAVELARRYGTDRSPAFVNGVLDGVARGLDSPV